MFGGTLCHLQEAIYMHTASQSTCISASPKAVLTAWVGDSRCVLHLGGSQEVLDL